MRKTWKSQNHPTVSIWTAASRSWYEQVCKRTFQPLLEELKVDFHQVWCREKCTEVALFDRDERFIVCTLTAKRMAKLFHCRSLPHTRHNSLIVDDTPSTYRYNYGNAVAISTYLGSSTDDSLLRLIPFLSQLLKTYEKDETILYTEKRFWEQKIPLSPALLRFSN